MWPRKRSRHEEDSYGDGVEERKSEGEKGGARNDDEGSRRGWRGRAGCMITGGCVFSSGSCRFRHEARSVLSSLRGEDRGRSLIQLRYTAIIALQPRLPSVIPAGVPWQLMNKANSGVMSPFRNALTKVFDGLLLAATADAASCYFNNGLSKCIAVRRGPRGTRSPGEICGCAPMGREIPYSRTLRARLVASKGGKSREPISFFAKLIGFWGIRDET